VVPGDEGFFVMCPPGKVEMVRRIVSAFDVQSNELLVKAAVIEYSDSQDAGAGLFGAVKALGGLLQLSIGAPAVGANYIGIKSSTVEALLSVAAGDSRFNVVHQSTLRVASGKGGRLQVGQDVPILGAVTLDKTGASVQSVSYRNTGLVVSVKPSLVGDRVQAELEHSVSSFAVTNSSKIDSPTFLTRSIQSQLVADLGEVLLIGGLDQATQSDAKSSVFGVTVNKTGRRDRSTLFLVLQFLKA
jgi:type II secretory pathway component GspD/PulD (secretin)